MVPGFLEELYRVQGLRTVVTGGGGMVGSALARGLARAGARVAVLDIRVEAAEAVADAVRAEGGEALALRADVLDHASLSAACDAVVTAFGGIDALVNVAGGNRPSATTGPAQTFFDLPREAFDGVMGLNCMGIVAPCQVFGRVIAAQGHGAIVNVASISGFRPMTNVPAYNAAKAAAINFTKWLAVYMSQTYGPEIRVNALAPGFMLTEQNRYLLLDRETGAQTARGRAITAHTPLGRYGVPEEMLGAVLWLISPAASFVHGTTITVDGGFDAYAGV